MPREASQKHGIEITALWAGWTGPGEWNFYGGPQTLGIVPPAYRFTRLKELMAGADFARQLGVTDVITHVGFLPENPNDPDFTGTCAALRHLANYLKANGQYFLFETGQETPVTMLRAIEEIGTDNLGINFDTANLILYGKANALDAIDIFGKYIRNTHMKDGEFPTCGKYLGVEKPLGQGRANIPRVPQAPCHWLHRPAGHRAGNLRRPADQRHRHGTGSAGRRPQRAGGLNVPICLVKDDKAETGSDASPEKASGRFSLHGFLLPAGAWRNMRHLL